MMNWGRMGDLYVKGVDSSSFSRSEMCRWVQRSLEQFYRPLEEVRSQAQSRFGRRTRALDQFLCVEKRLHAPEHVWTVT